MIAYERKAYGLNIWGRVRGSAICKAAIPGFVATIFYLVLAIPKKQQTILADPDALSLFVGAVTVLLVLRINSAYARYWEAATAIISFQAHCMNAVSHTAVFHMQCTHYDSQKPKSFFHCQGRNKSRAREDYRGSMQYRVKHKSIERVTESFTDRSLRLGRRGHPGNRQETSPLFLQELAHLGSLLSAVALGEMRSEPLLFHKFRVGAPWPPTSSALLPRRLSVLGGVSTAELRLLNMARGSFAKTMLCHAWLNEFIAREHLAGTLGNVQSPIVSWIVAFLSDAAQGFGQARKIKEIPFPFPHAQLSTCSVVLAMPAIAFLMNQYTSTLFVGAVLTCLTSTCLMAMNEVSTELEDPFRRGPNELPLITFQAQYNETLWTMFAGYYHPDLVTVFQNEEEKKQEEESIQESGFGANGRKAIFRQQ